ncbi:MAG: hypothetical protein J6B09_00615 [Clostridia bacterium]|nr:hypothetical protein [Clostridia bacterium]
MEYANIILEMLDRIKTLEKEVELLKKERAAAPVVVPSATSLPSEFVQTISMPSKRDTTRYLFESNVYLKNRLVLAVVRAYLRDNPDITREELKKVFSKSLQGSIGVVEYAEEAVMRGDYTVRFFAKPEEVLHLVDGDMYVCSQWGILNIPNFIKIAEQLEYKIESI